MRAINRYFWAGLLIFTVVTSHALPFISYYASKPKNISRTCNEVINICTKNCSDQYVCRHAVNSYYNYNACYGCQQLCVLHSCAKPKRLPEGASNPN